MDQWACEAIAFQRDLHVKEEEDAFLRTLEKGLKRIDEIVSQAKGSIIGKDAFELYDTFGFPIDLTRLIASENN